MHAMGRSSIAPPETTGARADKAPPPASSPLPPPPPPESRLPDTALPPATRASADCRSDSPPPRAAAGACACVGTGLRAVGEDAGAGGRARGDA
jgi:hypothetical protein